MQRPILAGLLTTLLVSTFAVAQTPPHVYTGSLGGGFALTGGNTDTKNFNLAFTLLRDPKTHNVVKATALYLRGMQNKALNLDRSALNVRDEYTVSERAFVFAQADYITDKFKDIRYLISPNGGVGYKLVHSGPTLFTISGGAGGIIEKNSGLVLNKSGSVNIGQNFTHKVSKTTSISESVASLWKTSDFNDSLTDFAAGLTTSLGGRIELKLQFLNSYKNKPPNVTIKKNDTAFVTTFVVKY